VVDEEAMPEQVARRLYTARCEKYPTASEAARILGVPGPTYLAHENGTRGIRASLADVYATNFGISTQWLLTGRGPMARDAAEQPQQTSLLSSPEHETENGLLRDIGAERILTGEIVARGPRTVPIALSSVRAYRGMILELMAIRPGPQDDPRLRRVDIGVDKGVFAVRGILRVPLDMAEHERLFAVRMPRNDLLPDMPGGQRVVVDVDDRHIGSGGLFMTWMHDEFVPTLIEPVDPGQSSDLYDVYRSRFMAPARLKYDAICIAGRMVMKLCQMTDLDTVRVKLEITSRPQPLGAMEA
jgi:hypothetical protein